MTTNIVSLSSMLNKINLKVEIQLLNLIIFLHRFQANPIVLHNIFVVNHVSVFVCETNLVQFNETVKWDKGYKSMVY